MEQGERAACLGTAVSEGSQTFLLLQALKAPFVGRDWQKWLLGERVGNPPYCGFTGGRLPLQTASKRRSGKFHAAGVDSFLVLAKGVANY